jgi:hypothetical protein
VSRFHRNGLIRHFGVGPPEALTRQQLANRVADLRQRGRRIEALQLTRDWLAARKVPA